MHDSHGNPGSSTGSAPYRLTLMHWLVIVLIAALVVNAGVLSVDIFTRHQSQVQRSASPGKNPQTAPIGPRKRLQMRSEIEETLELIRRIKERREQRFDRQDGWPAPQQLAHAN